MLTRYKKDERGVNIPIATIYNQEEHDIQLGKVDVDAVWVVKKLTQNGHSAYIVGGAVRDLLLDKVPKDFDITTSATPRQIHKLFYNARIIGKRFKLVHLTFKDKIIEVSTFRSGEENPKIPSDVYGTIEQDAKRRDFTLNALYYNPLDGHILDFNDSMKDIRKGKVKSVLPLSESFIEDPVRMIRAVKYSVSTQFSLAFDIKRAIRRDAHHLNRISSSRITEEVMKILASGNSSRMIGTLQKYRLLIYILPSISTHPNFESVLRSLESLDESIRSFSSSKGKKVISRSDMLYALVRALVTDVRDEAESEREFYQKIFLRVKEYIAPITPANYDVEHAAAKIVKSFGIVVASSWMKARKPIQRQVRNPKKGSGRKGRYPKIKGNAQPAQGRAKQHKHAPSSV
ncbi:MAG: poly(A) polymerase [Sphaerochaetaceae bacterium]|nr:poly(A) polymerase [Sphaerochaetaceae bacterium]